MIWKMEICFLFYNLFICFTFYIAQWLRYLFKQKYVFSKINGVFALYQHMIFIYISVFIIIAVKGVEVKSNNKYPLKNILKIGFLSCYQVLV